jgi:hypothetical protein
MMAFASYKKLLLFLAVLYVIFGDAYVDAQAPGKSKDPSPFGRPSALCTMFINHSAGTAANSALQKISAIMNSRGFQVDSVNWQDGELQASRKDSSDSNDIDRIVVWLERDFQQSDSRLKVYLLYGRFEKFFGSTEPERVVVDTNFSSQHIGAVKQDIVAHCLSGGPQ